MHNRTHVCYNHAHLQKQRSASRLIADIVREKTGDGALIIDFFTDVMTGRIEGFKLCHRIDAAKELVKYGSKDAASSSPSTKASHAVTPPVDAPTRPTPAPPRRGPWWP